MNSHNFFNDVARRRMFAALVFICTISGGADRSVNSQELTASILLRPHIENLNAKHDDITKAIEVFKTGDFIQAKQLLDSVCLADTSLPPSRLLLATMFQAANRPVLARAELENASRESPADPGAFLIFAESAIQNGRYSEAEILFDRANQLATKVTNNDYRKQNIQDRIAARILMNKNRAASKQLFEELIKNGRQFPGFNEAKTIYKTTIW